MSRMALVVLVATLVVAASAQAKEVTSVTCGIDRCRLERGISGIATLPGVVAAPARGRFSTVAVGQGDRRFTVAYESSRQLVRALDAHARSFLGRGWLQLTVDVRPHYRRAVRGLAPLRTAPSRPSLQRD
jgi:hypothetical protein